jgi:hypothetical protein
MIDARLIEVPKQRNNREENITMNVCQIPDAWGKPEIQGKYLQKDTDAHRIRERRNYNVTQTYMNKTLRLPLITAKSLLGKK